MSFAHGCYAYFADTESASEVRFADNEFDAKHYFLLRIRRASMSAKLERDMDQLYLEHNRPNRSIYGGIIQVELLPDRIDFTMSDEAAEALHCALLLQIPLAGPKKERLELFRFLRRMVKGHCKVIDDSATGLRLVKAALVGPATRSSQKLVAPIYLGGVLTLIGASMGYEKNGIIGCLIGICLGVSFLLFVLFLLAVPLRRFRSKEPNYWPFD